MAIGARPDRLAKLSASGSVFTIAEPGIWQLDLTANATAVLAFGPGSGTAYVIVKQDATGGRTFSVTTTVTWASGAPTISTGGGLATVLILTAQPSGGYAGRWINGIAAAHAPLPTTWTNAAASPTTQNLNLPGSTVARGTSATFAGYTYDAMTKNFTAAMRARIANNDSFAGDVCGVYPTDGLRGCVYRGFFEDYGGGYVRGSAFWLSNNSDGRAFTHEFCHSIDYSYYNRANATDPFGVDSISQHPTMQSVFTTCNNNGFASGGNYSEWFAELLSGKVRADNSQQLAQVGTGTTGTTPTQRVTNFNNYINSLSLV